MKIKYLDSLRLYRAFLAGGTAVVRNQEHLNKINVFPVPDSDTGTNLAATVRSIMDDSRVYPSFKQTFGSIADAALMGARGNSGIIFAQFLYGMSQELGNERRISPHSFAEAAKRAVAYVYTSLVKPVEGTILTVIHDWAHAIAEESRRTNDFFHIFVDGVRHAQRSLSETPKKLRVLAEAGVVDAGGQGFVDFLEGIRNLIVQGFIVAPGSREASHHNQIDDPLPHEVDLMFQYCTEAMLSELTIDLPTLRDHAVPFGDSIVVAGSSRKMRLHIHTNAPSELFFKLKDVGTISQIKVTDMRHQYNVAHHRRFPIALVTDSTCDLPQAILEQYQIHVIPFPLSFGDTMFLDRVTINPKQFYHLLRTHPIHPKTAQPPVREVQSLFSFLASHYESIIAIHISDKLTGIFNMSTQVGLSLNKRSDVINSRSISAGLGLTVYRAALAIEQGTSHDDVLRLVAEWTRKSFLYADIRTLKYLVRGGRISAAKGVVARLFNLRPLISVDAEGKGAILGKSITDDGNVKKLLALVEKAAANNPVWNYAVVHADASDRAQMYAEEVQALVRKPPLYIEDISPVIGAHNGLGCVGVALMLE
ncbi:MAG: DegV family EDD domain-containing protein [Ignavibacteria bacterium]|nr:DegV family EDD domain-containing protein [Ignavibacteria bacterium]